MAFADAVPTVTEPIGSAWLTTKPVLVVLPILLIFSIVASAGPITVPVNVTFTVPSVIDIAPGSTVFVPVQIDVSGISSDASGTLLPPLSGPEVFYVPGLPSQLVKGGFLPGVDFFTLSSHAFSAHLPTDTLNVDAFVANPNAPFGYVTDVNWVFLNSTIPIYDALHSQLFIASQSAFSGTSSETETLSLVVPEPGSFYLLSIGLAVFLFLGSFAGINHGSCPFKIPRL